MEQTLAILKPDCIQKKLAGRVIALIEDGGFAILEMKMLTFTRQSAEGFYSVHRGKDFFNGLIDFMLSGPVIVMVLEREGAIAALREIMGKTDPGQAAPGTIRKMWAENTRRNIIHGSDGSGSAGFEIRYFFGDKAVSR